MVIVPANLLHPNILEDSREENSELLIWADKLKLGQGICFNLLGLELML